MKTSRYIALAAAAALLPLLGGCQTASDSKSIEGNVRVNKGAYSGSGSPITNDIKSILIAGGLDLANPSAPTSNTAKAEIAKSQAPASTESLVAALSDKTAGSTVTSVAAAQTPEVPAPARTASLAKPSRSEPKPSSALALAEESTPKEKQVKTVFETRLDVDDQPLKELASINGTDSPVVSDGAFSVAYPLPESMTPPTQAKNDKVDKPAEAKPLPTATVAKSARPPQVATNDDVSQKKSRIRRF
ncbi:hypothetical protein [Rhizobium leguminosarum]|uniref:hypothetical protein n=1 Tax=Rhizobium leguminosarum TaxID=384 RepID=UPI002E0E24CF|nr:hypothetical protein U8Q02_37445 [Rhizobium leguminosarum]